MVDGERKMGAILSDLLTEMGFKVIATSDGFEAREVIKATETDRITTGFMMPDIAAVELTAAHGVI